LQVSKRRATSRAYLDQLCSNGFRRRRASGLHRRPVDVTTAQLDALEQRGYLDPDRRGDRVDETEAIEMFLADSLVRSG